MKTALAIAVGALEKIRVGTCECPDDVTAHRHRMEANICEQNIARDALAAIAEAPILDAGDEGLKQAIRTHFEGIGVNLTPYGACALVECINRRKPR